MNKKVYDWDQDHPHIKWLVSALVFLIAMVIGMVSVRGQFGVEQPIFQLTSSSTTPTPPESGYMFYWWLSSDTTTNVTTASWTDRISGSIWTNGNASARPTNSALGMHFKASSSQRFTNSAPNGTHDKYTFVFILNPDSTPTFAELVLLNSSGATPSMMYNGGSFKIYEQPSLYDFGAINTGLDTDVILTIDGAGAGATAKCYTNGVVSKTLTMTQLNGTVLGILGGGPTGYYDGYIREFIVYTNIVFNSTQVSNLHYYRTNLYGGSP